MSAIQTLKRVPLPVGFVDKPASGARLRRIGRIDLLPMETFHRRQKLCALFQNASCPLTDTATNFLALRFATNVQLFSDDSFRLSLARDLPNRRVNQPLHLGALAALAGDLFLAPQVELVNTLGFRPVAFRFGFLRQLMEFVALTTLVENFIRSTADHFPKLRDVARPLFIGEHFTDAGIQPARFTFQWRGRFDFCRVVDFDPLVFNKLKEPHFPEL